MLFGIFKTWYLNAHNMNSLTAVPESSTCLNIDKPLASYMGSSLGPHIF